jgi:HD-like signal output (HDOD) protein
MLVQSKNELAKTLLAMKAGGLKELPAVSPMARKLLDYDNLTELELFRIIESDPGMAAKVVGISNSLMFRVGGPPSTTLREALLRVGYDHAHSIALSSALLGRMTAQRCTKFDTRAEWRHAMAVAFCARQMGSCLGYAKFEPAVAFIAGLVHDIGLLALATLSPLMFDELVDSVQRNEALPVEQQKTLQQLEEEVLGLTHSMLGEEVAKFWGLPDETIAAIRWHRDPWSAPAEFRDLAVAIHALEILARSAGAPSLVSLTSAVDPEQVLPEAAIEYLGLNRERIPEMLSAMKDKVGWVDEILRLGAT